MESLLALLLSGGECKPPDALNVLYPFLGDELIRRWLKCRPHLNGQTYRINAFVNVVNSTGYLNTTDYALIGKQTFAQCDELDGLQDGIIADPTICHPDLSSIICSDGKKVDGCILQEQADTMHQIWANWTSTEGEWLFPGFQPGAEASPAFSVTGVPYGESIRVAVAVEVRSAQRLAQRCVSADSALLVLLADRCPWTFCTQSALVRIITTIKF